MKDHASKPGLHIGELHWRHMARSLIRRCSKDRLADQSAQLSYYFLFAVFPMLLFLTALVGFFAVPGTVTQRVISQYLGAILPHQASSFIDSSLREIASGSSAGKLTLGLLIALWSGSSGMGAIIHGLDLAYGVRDERPWWREKILALVLTVVVTFLMVVALLLVVSGGDLAAALAARFAWGEEFTLVWNVAQWPVLLMFVLLAFGLIYYFAPNIPREQLRRLVPGTVIGVGIWLLVSLAFRYYVHHFGHYSVTYGAIGAVIVLMLWFYLSSMAILIGGEVNSILERALEDAGGGEP
ncbi:MAG TPA: YihY/virulence factor BrkB family protein [Candidatus Baltobacteraceae bacterium]|jgi:membrane protein|nr:YihY/virulence factor BrkB family protein [Candidatus Baltobacteraceae bacterium]